VIVHVICAPAFLIVQPRFQPRRLPCGYARNRCEFWKHHLQTCTVPSALSGRCTHTELILGRFFLQMKHPVLPLVTGFCTPLGMRPTLHRPFSSLRHDVVMQGPKGLLLIRARLHHWPARGEGEVAVHFAFRPYFTGPLQVLASSVQSSHSFVLTALRVFSVGSPGIQSRQVHSTLGGIFTSAPLPPPSPEPWP